jgi:putative ABC transport system substrate-binding protein
VAIGLASGRCPAAGRELAQRRVQAKNASVTCYALPILTEEAIITITNSNLFIQQKRIVDLAITNRLPSMYQGSTWVESGGLMSYSTNDTDAFRRAAIYVDKILKGAKPADLPVEQPTKFEFVINLKAAKQIGLTIPPNVLARADRVIK